MKKMKMKNSRPSSRSLSTVFDTRGRVLPANFNMNLWRIPFASFKKISRLKLYKLNRSIFFLTLERIGMNEKLCLLTVYIHDLHFRDINYLCV